MELNVNKKAPKWAKSIVIDKNNNVYFPAVISGNEVAAFLTGEWLKQEYPHTRELIENIERKDWIIKELQVFFQ